jgi:hypothetical protein
MMSDHSSNRRTAVHDIPVTLNGETVLVIPPPPRADAFETAADWHHEHRLRRLIDRLPDRLRSGTTWLRRPSSRWARMPVGALLVLGGLLSFLPVLGLWMLPLGLVLLAEDVPALRRMRGRTLHWLAQRRPHWFADRGDVAIPVN